MLLLAGVHVHILVSGVFAHNHAFVYFNPRFQEEFASVQNGVQAVGSGNTCFKSNQGASGSFRNIALVGCIALEYMVHNAGASGGGEQFISEADEAAGRDGEFHLHVAGQFFHGNHFRSSGAKAFHDSAHEFLRHFNGQSFQRFALLAIDDFVNNLGFGNFQFKSFTAHGFDEYGEMEFAAAGHFESIGCIGVFYAKSHIGFDFLVETGTDVTGGHEVPFLASKGALVDMEYHGQGRFVDVDGREGFRIGGIGYGFTDVDILEACHGDDVAGFGFLYGSPFHSLPGEEGADMVAADLGAVSDGYRHALFGGAPGQTADGYFTQIIIGFQGGHHNLQAAVGIHIGAGAVFKNGIEEGSQVLAFIIHMELGNAVSGRAVNQREIQLVIICFQFDEEVQNFAFHVRNTLVRTVDLIDDNDRFQLMFQCLSEDVLGLGHRAFMGVYQKEYAVYHVQDTFHFAAEVSMPWGINDVDFNTIVHDGSVLCQNGNASFPFQRVGVHDTFCYFLVVPENMTLFQHGIDKGRLAMVDMGDNGNVADIFSFHSFFFPLGYYKINVSLSLYHKDAKLFVSRKYNSLYHGFSCLRRFFIFLPEERLPKGCGKISALYPQLPGTKRNPCCQGEGFHSL